MKKTQGGGEDKIKGLLASLKPQSIKSNGRQGEGPAHCHAHPCSRMQPPLIMHGTPCKKDGGRHRNCRMQTPFQTTNAQRPAKKPEQKRRHPIQAGLTDIIGISERLRPTDNQACRRQPPHMTTGPVQEIPDDMKQDQVPEKPERWIEGGFSYSEKATQKDFRRHLPDENAFHRSVNQIPEEIGNRQSKHAIHDLSPAGWNKIRRQKKEEEPGRFSNKIE